MTGDQNTTESNQNQQDDEDEKNPATGAEDDEFFDDPEDGEMPAEAFPPMEEDEESDDPHALAPSGDDLFVPTDEEGDGEGQGEESEADAPKRRRAGRRRSTSALKESRKAENSEQDTPMGGGVKIAPALVPLLVPIDDIEGDPANPRLTRRLDVLKGAFQRFGVRKPIVVNQNNKQIEAGHQSVAALKELGATHVPVVWVDDNEIEQQGYNISDNRTGEVVADWDESALSQMLEELDDADALDGLGFNDRELDDILGAVTNDEKLADDFLGDDFVLPTGDIEDKTAMDKITLFVVVDKKRALLQALERVRNEIGDDLVRIMK